MSFEILNPDFCLIPKEIYYVNWKKYYQDFHQHKEGCIEIDYIVDGSCIYHLSDHAVRLNRRSLLIHNGANPHDYEVPDSCLNMSILCSQESLCPNSGSFGNLLEVFPYMQGFFGRLDQGIILKNAGTLFPAVQEINDVFRTGEPAWYLNLLTNKLLIAIMNAAYYQTPSRTYTEQIKSYIHYHYFEINSLEMIAEHLALNKIYMERLFKQETGMSVWNYLNDVRMERAAYYLTNLNYPVGDIDDLVGIHSRQNFYLLFKKKYGISPSQYRKKAVGK